MGMRKLGLFSLRKQAEFSQKLISIGFLGGFTVFIDLFVSCLILIVPCVFSALSQVALETDRA
jgi:hypothetical protein